MSKRHLDIWRDLGITLRFLFKLSRINLCRSKRHKFVSIQSTQIPLVLATDFEPIILRIEATSKCHKI